MNLDETTYRLNRLARFLGLNTGTNRGTRYADDTRNYFESCLHEIGHLMGLTGGLLEETDGAAVLKEYLNDIHGTPEAREADDNEAFALAFEIAASRLFGFPVGRWVVDDATTFVTRTEELRAMVDAHLRGRTVHVYARRLYARVQKDQKANDPHDRRTRVPHQGRRGRRLPRPAPQVRTRRRDRR